MAARLSARKVSRRQPPFPLRLTPKPSPRLCRPRLTEPRVRAPERVAHSRLRAMHVSSGSSTLEFFFRPIVDGLRLGTSTLATLLADGGRIATRSANRVLSTSAGAERTACTEKAL